MNNLVKKISFFFIKSKDQQEVEKVFSGYKCKLENSNGRVLIDFTHACYPKWNVKNFFISQISTDENLISDAYYPSKFHIWFNKKVWILSILQLFFNKEKSIIKSVVNGCIVSLPSISSSSKLNIIKKSYVLWENLESKKDLLGINIDGIAFGDLIYDTYLKWFKKPTVKLGSIKLLMIIIHFFLYKEKVEKLIELKKYKKIYLTHSAYIAFGVLARVAINKNVKVYVIQNTRGQFFKSLNKDDFLQTPDFSNYRSKLKSLKHDDILRLRSQAKKNLEDRFNGIIDPSISYMRVSPFSKNNGCALDFSMLDINKEKPRVLILLHCFFDSPHIYKWMLFEDFYVWIKYTLDFFEGKGLNVYVKPHPNGIHGNDNIVEVLKKRYKEVVFLDKSVSNNELMDPDVFPFALTVYGTMAHEFAYKGVTVINAGDNPHADFDFTINPKSEDAYRKALGRVTTQDMIIPDKEQILDFYICHNFLGDYYDFKKWNDLFENYYGTRSSYNEVKEALSAENIENIFLELKTINYLRSNNVE